MRVILSAPDPIRYIWEETGTYIQKALLRAGHEVFRVDHHGIVQDFGKYKGSKLWLDIVNGIKPELLIVLKGDALLSNFIGKAQAEIKTLYHPDVRERVEPWVVAHGKYCDYFFTMSYGSLAEYKEKGINAFYVPEAADPDDHRYITDIHENVRERVSSDVSFIGGVRQKRISMLTNAAEVCEEKGYSLKIWGSPNAGTFGLKKYSTGEYAWRERHSVVCSCNKISLDYGWCPQVERSYSARIYRVMAAKCLFLTKYVNGMEKTFVPGKHLEAFNTYDELKEKIVYYIDNPKEREKIAEAGMKEIQDKHLWDHRITDIMKIIGGDKDGINK